MTWEWSHTAEAYSNAYAQLCQQSDEWLAECAAEWAMHNLADGKRTKTGIFHYAYSATLKRIREHDHRNIVIADIWEMASEDARCTNGGHSLHMCPYECHSVPVEPTQCPECGISNLWHSDTADGYKRCQNCKYVWEN